MTPRTRANLAIFVILTFPMWATVAYLTLLYVVVPVTRVWLATLGWLGTLPFWWVKP